MNAELLRRSWRPAVVLSALCACAAPGVEKPAPPDMGQLLQRYESPTGSFDPEDSTAVATTVTLLDEVVGDTDVVPRVTELLREVIRPLTSLRRREPEEPDTGSDQPFELSLRADGYLVATRICPGWTLPSVVDAENGQARVTATFSEAGLDPVVWGTVSDCRYRVGDRRIELVPSGEGDALRVHLGDGARLAALTEAGALLSLALRARVDGAELDLDLDLRLADDDALEYLLPAGDGWLVVRANEDGTFAVRSIEGSFECDEGFSCEPSGAANEP